MMSQRNATMIDATFQKFSKSLLPIFQGFIAYSDELAVAISEPTTIAALSPFINCLMDWHHSSYPEWVLQPGFNRHLRGGFRYVLIHLNEISDAFLSLDYHVRHIAEIELLQDIVPALSAAIMKNKSLLSLIATFFAGQPIDQSETNLTSDIADLYNAGRSVLPQSLELMGLNPDHLHLAALMRDVVDIREILLKILTALPIDDLAVTE